MATIRDVAKQAGVSTTTVSHVINKTRFVAENTQKAVMDAIKALNYSPSAVARSLKVNQTNTIGLLAVSNDSPYFAEVIRAVENSCYQKGYTLVLCNSQHDIQKQRSYLTMLAQKRVDGLLVMCSEYSPELLKLLHSYQSIPMMVMDWGKSSDFTDNIEDNSFQGAYMAAKYLIERGHRDIGTITGRMNEHTGRERYKGFMQALKEAKISAPKEWIIESDFHPELGYQAMQQILEQKKKPTAVFCGGDVIAMGAISAIAEAGLSVPEDISVIGYDNLHNSRYFNPALTTIHQPKEHLGEIALNMLLDRIINKREEFQAIELKPKLIERRSVNDGPYKE
jgi:LacI family purine nucleotide synthesis repressor